MKEKNMQNMVNFGWSYRGICPFLVQHGWVEQHGYAYFRGYRWVLREKPNIGKKPPGSTVLPSHSLSSGATCFITAREVDVITAIASVPSAFFGIRDSATGSPWRGSALLGHAGPHRGLSWRKWPRGRARNSQGLIRSEIH